MQRTSGPTLPSTTTRMTWLYNTLSRYGESFEFGQPSRAWLIDRLAVSDYSSRRDRAPSEWWEEDKNALSNNNNNSNHTSTTKPKLGRYPSSASIRSGMFQREPPPDLSLSQVLASSTYRADFENFLEENLAGPALPFREAVNEWQDKYKTAHVWDPKGLDRLKGEAIKIYQQFLAATASEKLEIDRTVLSRLKKALKIETQPPQMLRSASEASDDLDSLTVHQMLERAEEYVDHALARRVLDTLQVIPQEDQEGLCERAFAILTDKVKPKLLVDPDDDGIPVEFSGVIFADALKQITQMIESLFLDFKQTDDYADMFETENSSAIIRPSASVGSSSSEIEESVLGCSSSSNSEESNNDDLLLENDTNRLRCPAWYNSEGWRSLRCEVLDLHTKLINVRAIINMDSTTYRTSLADRDFRAGVSAEFALTNTTQYLTIRLRSGNRLAGVLDLSMFAISQMAQGAETLHSVKQVSKNQNLAKMELKLKITCRKEEPSACSLQQVLVEGMKGNFTTSLARGLVSKKKRRFQQDGFDLDLSYVTDQLIAMGYPSSGAEGVYRNPLESVQKFFALRHPQAYLLYNLCSERQYDISKFQGRVRCFPCDDHNPPPFSMFKRFCEDVRVFLNEHPQHAVSIHCKAGKGRTGTMIAAYMCYTGMEPNSHAALSTFAHSRTKNGKGVTIPSQERYVHYFGKYCKLKRSGKRMPGRTTLILQTVNLHEALLQSNSTIVFSVTQRPETEDESLGLTNASSASSAATTAAATAAGSATAGAATSGAASTATGSVENSIYHNEDKPRWHKYSKILSWDMSKYVLALSDDVLFEFYEKTLSGNKVKLFQFWFNTRMCELKYLDNLDDPEPRLILEKKELDKASKDTKHKDYSPDFKVELVFALTCSSGVVKTQELEERSEPPSTIRSVTSPTRKLPPPLPASYSTRKLPGHNLSHTFNLDRDSLLLDEESSRPKAHTPLASSSSSSCEDGTTKPPSASSSLVRTASANSNSSSNNSESSRNTAPNTATTLAASFHQDDGSFLDSLSASTSKLQPISIDASSPFSSVEIPEPSSPVPSKPRDPSDEGLEEHFSLLSEPSATTATTAVTATTGTAIATATTATTKENISSLSSTTAASSAAAVAADTSSSLVKDNDSSTPHQDFVQSKNESDAIVSQSPALLPLSGSTFFPSDYSLFPAESNPFVTVISETSLPSRALLPPDHEPSSVAAEKTQTSSDAPTKTESADQTSSSIDKEPHTQSQSTETSSGSPSDITPPPPPLSVAPSLERIPTGEQSQVNNSKEEPSHTSSQHDSFHAPSRTAPSRTAPSSPRVAALPRTPPVAESLSRPDSPKVSSAPPSIAETSPQPPNLDDKAHNTLHHKEKVATLPRAPDADTAAEPTRTERVATPPRPPNTDAAEPTRTERIATLPGPPNNETGVPTRTERVATLPRSPPTSDVGATPTRTERIPTLPGPPIDSATPQKAKVATLPRSPPTDSDAASIPQKVATLPRDSAVTSTPQKEKIAPLPRTPSSDNSSAPFGGSEDETTKAFCERLFGTSKPRMDMALAALTSFGVENPRADMEPWIERDWIDFEKSTNKVVRAKVQTDLATAIVKPSMDRYEALRRQAEEAEVALRAEIRAKPPPPPKRVQVPAFVKAFEGK